MHEMLLERFNIAAPMKCNESGLVKTHFATRCHDLSRRNAWPCVHWMPARLLDALLILKAAEVNITHEHDDATFSRMMFASNPLQLCNLIPIVHRDNLRGDRNQWAYDLDNRVKASDHIGICNVMGDHFDSSQKQQSDGRNPQQTIVRSSLRSECRYALAALGYFTRLPMPRWV